MKPTILEATCWKKGQGIVANFQAQNGVLCWILYMIALNNKRATKLCQAYYFNQFKKYSPRKQKQELEYAFGFLKQELTNKDRQKLQISDKQWKSWQRMLFCLSFVVIF